MKNQWLIFKNNINNNLLSLDSIIQLHNIEHQKKKEIELIKQKQKEKDEEINKLKEIQLNQQIEFLIIKKYNDEEWNKIYQKRFKDYEEYKKKRVEVEVQKKKIQKMIEEEEEINMCNVKKLPENKIKENTQRLYDEAKKIKIK